MQKNRPAQGSRRRFLLGGLAVTGALIVGWGVMPPRQRVSPSTPFAAPDGEAWLNGWLRIGADGQVVLAMPRSEMGQGVHSALPMLVAEELDIPLSAVRIEQAPRDRIFGNVAMLADGLPFHPDDNGVIKRTAVWMTAKFASEIGLNATGGSSTVKDAWEPLRQAAASARAMLLGAAAKAWNVPLAECQTAEGFVTHASGKRASFGELATQAAAIVPGDVKPKDPAQFRLIGTPQPRRDSQDKVNGKAVFGLDVRPPGLLYAAVKMAPMLGGQSQAASAAAAAFDAAQVRQQPGVVEVVDFSFAGAQSGVAVIARSWWQAKQALAAVPVTWAPGEHAALTSEAVFAELAAVLDKEEGFTYFKSGDKAAAAKTVAAEYRAPFLAHAALEPINCTAQVKDGKVTVWASTQVPGLAADAAAKVAGVSSDQVTVHVTYLGGGFGRRLEVDMVRQAVAVAMAAKGAPVQLIWSREDDTQHDFYRPAAVARFSAGLDGQGKLLSWENKSASASIVQQVLKRTFGLPGAGPDKTAAEGEFDLPYEIPYRRVGHEIVPTPVPVGFWRSVGHSHNAFFKESFLDEVAHASGQDPVALRRALLQQHPRHLAVLDAAVKAADSAGPAAAGRARGVALHQSFGSIVAQVAEVSLAGQDIVVHKVWCAIDCGIAVNPNIIAQQMESSVVFALTAALFGEITFKEGRVQQSNFHDYPLLRLNQAPVVETIVVKSAHAPEGVGEPGVPPLAPAVANALFALTGKRLRSLPLRI